MWDPDPVTGQMSCSVASAESITGSMRAPPVVKEENAENTVCCTLNNVLQRN